MHDCLTAGHQSVTCILERIQLYTTWPNIEQEIKEYIRNCQKNKHGRETKQMLEITGALAHNHETKSIFILSA